MALLRMLSIFFVLFLFSIPLNAEYLFLKDGSIIKGSIIKETATGVTFRSEDKKTAEYPRVKVLRVLYTEINMSKLYVQLKNGDNMRVFMVDEDRESYTFRKELYNPDEFQLKRSDVMFMAERNPSGLKGIPDFTAIELNWFPPYDQMKYYNIYVKNKKADKFVLAGTSGKNSFRLEDLKGNTKYFISVTGVDANKDETPHSNLLEISTRNMPPSEPESLKITEDEKGVFVAEWEPSEDTDGTVKNYKLYIIKDKTKSLLNETKDTRIKINKAPEEIDRIQVAAVDNNGGESEPADLRAFPPFIDKVTITPAVIIPFAEFGEMGGLGYGGFASLAWNDIFYKNTMIGLEAGYFSIPGVDSLDSEGQKIDKISFAPFGLKAGYEFKLNADFRLMPSITAGGAYISTAYTNRDIYTGEDSDGSNSAVDIMALFSINVCYDLTENLFLGINGGYGMLFEQDAMLPFAVTGLEIGWRF